MPRYHYAIATAIVFLLITSVGCSGSKDLTRSLPPTMSTVKPAKGLQKKIGIVLKHSQTSSKERMLGTLFLKTMIEALHDEDDSLNLITEQEADFPQFLNGLASATSTRLDTEPLAAEGRQAGFHGLMAASVEDVRAFTKKTGILWFRRPRYFIALDITLELVDPYTTAKIVDAVEELTVKISPAEYDAFSYGETEDLEKISDVVVDTAEDLAETVAEAMEELPWQCSVIAVHPDRLILPAGTRAGLRQGQRLAVFEGRRIVKGYQDKRFIIPGQRVGEVQITALDDQEAEAVGEDLGSIQAGDIAVPVK
jgi:hypothetical protein